MWLYVLLRVSAREVTTILGNRCLFSERGCACWTEQRKRCSLPVAHPITTRFWTAKIQAGTSHSPKQEEPCVPSGPSFFGPGRVGKTSCPDGYTEKNSPQNNGLEAGLDPSQHNYKGSQPPLYVLLEMIEMFLQKRKHVPVLAHEHLPTQTCPSCLWQF